MIYSLEVFFLISIPLMVIAYQLSSIKDALKWRNARSYEYTQSLKEGT